MHKFWLLATLGVLPLTACATSTDDTGTKTATAQQGPTFYKDVQPLLQARCQSCHVAGGIAPFPLVTYAQAKGMAAAMVAATAKGTMPPWGAWETDACKPRLPLQHDLRLGKTELAVLADWASHGTPEGKAADAPKDVKTPSLLLENVDQTAKPKLPFVASGNADQFRCFVLDATFAERKYLNGIQIVAGNNKVVHHALVFTAPVSEIAKKKLDADDGYDCFGGIGLNGQQLVGAWAPGSVPLDYPADVGAILEKGTRLVMQVHYHPIGSTGESDLTQVQLRYTKGMPAWLGVTALVGNFAKQGSDGMGLQPDPDDRNGKAEFRIPAGKQDHVETMKFTLPAQLDGKPMPDLHVFGVGTHMHFVGTGMRIEVDRTAALKPPCDKAQLQPLTACTTAKCAGLKATELATCAVTQCKDAAGALTTSCGDCLKAEIVKPDVSDQQVYGVCTTPPPAPAGVAQPAQECLIETPKWDFNWQRVYNYAAPLESLPILRAGDELHLTCKYDNSMTNPFVQLALMQQKLSAPVDVSLGETTLDEMCLAVVQVLYKP
jgi:mono/diheme cytochrome c family protein